MKTTIPLRTSLLLLALFTFTSAQALTGLPTLPNTSDQTSTATNGGNSKSTQTSASATGKDSHDGKSSTTSGAQSTATSAPQSSATSATFALTGAPTLSSSYAAALTGLPTIEGVGVPSLVIPNTANAPFMQKSNLPEGTVFICVGAALGFLFMCVIGWRILVAWSLHRSIKRVAAAQYVADKKARYQPSGMYSTTNLSLENLTALNSSTYAGSRPPAKKPSRQTTPNASLFFSPTAGGAGIHSTSGRTSSTYLPAGYYASGASAPAAGSAIAHLGGGPPAAGYGRLSSSHVRIPSSPPESPLVHPLDRPGDRSSAYSSSRVGLSGPGPLAPSRSSTSLGVQSQQRAPSAYLEDLFQSHGQGPKERF